jgi:uncharacterized membrane protein YcaP (DUF421 family)
MDTVLRAAVIYLFLMVLLRLAGSRTLANVTTFDFVLLLIIGDATQQALLGQDFSLVNAFVAILTLVTLDVGLSFLKRRPAADEWLEGAPVVLVEGGRLHRDRMLRCRVDEEDIVSAAQRQLGLERLEQVKYAVLDRSGAIAVIPWRREHRDER